MNWMKMNQKMMKILNGALRMISVEILLVILLIMMNSRTEHHVISFTSKVNLLFLVTFVMLKGCLHYKMITSQNVRSETQIKNFSFFAEKLCSILKIFKFFYFEPSHDLPNLWCHDEDLHMRQGTLLNHNSQSHQTWPVDRYKPRW